MAKIRYLLILVNREPRGGKDDFIEQLLDSLYTEGRPYRAYVDGQTKVALQGVRTQHFDDRLVAASAEVFFPRIWGYKPNLDNITHHLFFGKGVSGTAVTEWESERGPIDKQPECSAKSGGSSGNEAENDG